MIEKEKRKNKKAPCKAGGKNRGALQGQSLFVPERLQDANFLKIIFIQTGHDRYQSQKKMKIEEKNNRRHPVSQEGAKGGFALVFFTTEE